MLNLRVGRQKVFGSLSLLDLDKSQNLSVSSSRSIHKSEKSPDKADLCKESVINKKVFTLSIPFTR